MAELKTKPTAASVTKFLDAIPDERRRKDCYAVLEMMERGTGSQPVMWGPSIVGLGSCTYRYPNGKEMPWFPVGFSPRKAALTLYVMEGLRDEDRLKRLGKHRVGKGCLYIKRLSDVNLEVLAEIINAAAKAGREA